MAVRQDQVQIRIDFVTDESKAFAQTINATKDFNKQIAESKAKIAQYQKQLVAAGTDEQKRVAILAKISIEENKVAEGLNAIAEEAKKVAKIDLTKLTPAQLAERARQLAQAMRDIPASAPQFRVLEAELKDVNTQLGIMRNNSKGAGDGTKGLGGSFGGLAGFAAKAGAAVGAVYAVISGIGGVVNATRETEKLFAVLKNGLGNENRANAVFQQLQDFAATTPFALNEVVGAFTKLQQRNFNPTIEQLRTMGDIAAASGKSIDQFVEAILDAQTGEFERLKEFGVVARKEGENVRVTFRGQAETFKNTAENLNAYLLKLGELPGIQGATAAVAATLDGSLSNLGDNFTRLFATIGSGGGVLKSIVDGIGALVNRVNEFLTVPVVEKLEEEKTAFGGLSAQILNANVGSKERTELIGKLQQQYPEFLKGIDAEKATNEQLKPILDKINQSYIVRIALQKQQDKIKPLLEAEAETADRLAEKRVNYNRELAKGAELVGINLADFQTEAERVAAVQQALQEKVRQQGQNFSLTASAESKALSRIIATSSITSELSLQQTQQTRIAEAEKRRVEVIEELRKSYGSLVDEVQKSNTAQPATAPEGGGTGAGKGGPSEDRIKKALDLELKAIEAATLRREVVLEKFRADATINEERYQDGLLGIQQRKYQEQLEVYRRFKQEQTEDALKVQKQLLEIEQRTTRTTFVQEVAPLPGRTPAAPTSQQDNTAQRLAVQDVGEEALLAALRSKFEDALIVEQDYELQRLELKRLALAEEIAILQSATQPQVDEIRKREEEKAKVEEKISLQRIENEKRTEQLRQQVAQAGIQATSDVFAVAAELLAQDEAARKKNASTIKAFQTAQVIVQGIAEVQKIWAGAASLGPIAGPIIGAIQTGVAVARTAIAINKIQSAKFQRGGDVDVFGLPAPVAVQPVAPMRRVLARFGLGPKRGASAGGTVQGQGADGSTFQVRPSQTMVVVNKRNTPLLQRIAPEIGTMMRHMERAWVFGGRAHSEGGTPVRFSNGAEIEVERGEAGFVVDRGNTRLLSRLSELNAQGGHGRPFFQKGGVVRFAEGGVTNVNTTPTDLPTPSQQEISVALANMGTFVETVEMFQQTVAAFPTEVKSRVVYTEIEHAGAVLDEVREDAAI